MSVNGRRLADVRFGDLPLPLDDLRPGDIWRYLNADGTPVSAKALYPNRDMSGNLTDEVWGYYAPNGDGIGTMSLHTVRSHDDGTISIRPGDGSSNSVLHQGPGGTWHGYVDHNDWQTC
jgi:hypothetical protein